MTKNLSVEMTTRWRKEPRGRSWDAHDVSSIIVGSTEMIQIRGIYASIEPRKSIVHKDLLCFFSPYYTAALTGRFKEASLKCLDLELDSGTLELLVAWLYSGRVTQSHLNDGLVNLYILADRTDMLALRRSILSEVMNAKGKLPTFTCVSLALRSLPESSSLCRWMIQHYAHKWDAALDTPADEEEAQTTVPGGFFYKVIRSSVTLDFSHICTCSFNPCDYHEHESKQEWENTCGQANNCDKVDRNKPPAASCLKDYKPEDSEPEESGSDE